MASDLEIAVANRFPPHQHARALESLAQYGLEPYEREIDRVRRVIVQTAAGSIERLERLVVTAKRDYRDVLIGDRGAKEPWP
jgi:hypothetical protein